MSWTDESSKDSAAEPERSKKTFGLTRRAALRTGTAAAVTAMSYSTPLVRTARAASGLSPGTISISNVSPLSGVEGDLITIDGSGFGTNPDDLCIFFGGMGAPGRVTSASPTQLVGEIGPVPALSSGDVSVVCGQGSVATVTTIVQGGRTTDWTGSKVLEANQQADAGVAFSLTAVTANCNAGVLAGNDLDVVCLAANTGDMIIVDVHLHCGIGEWVEIVAKGTVLGPNMTAAEVAAHVAAMINAGYAGQAVSASSLGATVTITKTGIIGGSFGSITVK